MNKHMMMDLGSGSSGATYKGLDCVADAQTALYASYHKQLQAEVPWTEQPKYAKYTVYFGVVVVFIAMVKNLWYRVKDRRYGENHQTYGSIFSSFWDVITSYCRFFGYKQLPLSLCKIFGLPPSVGSFLFMAASAFYLFCYCFIPHFWYRGCGGFGSPPLAVRAGVMATALTPFVYLLSGKCNMISLLTGISYEKLNSIHQFVGLAALVLSIIHTIPFIHQDLVEIGTSGLRKNFSTDFYYKSGLPPLILLGLLCTLSNKWVRRQCYEVFVSSHWAFGIAYFGTLVWHINKSLDMQNYMWGALAFWASQIGYRILVKTAFKPNALFLRPRLAKLTRSGPNAFLVSIPGNSVSCMPGQHCYLRFYGSRILDNHPFSVATIPDEENPDMKFVVVPKKGLTKKLQMELEQNISMNKKVYVDGPYGGSSRDSNCFDKLILLATGSGVSAVLPFLMKLANFIAANRQNEKVENRQKVHFVWIVRYEHDIGWFQDEISRCIERAGDALEVSIYVCQKGYVENEAPKAKEEEIETTRKDLGIDVVYGKPDITQVLRTASVILGRRNMIVSSGSDSMKAAVSQVASKLQARVFNSDANHQGVEEVYLHTESFGW